MADGCGAQNKNSIMISMCAKWLTQAPLHIKTVELVFPISGHSFIPPDRVFGLVEKEIKRIETILKPVEYVEVFEKYGTVMLLNNVKDRENSSRKFNSSTRKLAFPIQSM